MRLATTLNIVIAALVTTGCGHQPAVLASRRNIFFTRASENHAIVSALSAEDFPALAKFRRLFEVDFVTGATDEKLRALADVRLTNLTHVVLTDCPLVTDKGVEFLAKISSLRGLGLRNVPQITDKTCETIANKMRIQHVNLPDCPKVTIDGLTKLTESKSIGELGFSLGNLTQDDLVRLIAASRHLTRIDIVLTAAGEKKLDIPSLRKAARPKNIELFAVRNNVGSRL